MTPGTDSGPAAPRARRGRRDPFRWIIENPGTVDLIVFGTVAFFVLLFSVGTSALGWWTLFTVPMVLAGSVCRIRPLLGVLVIGGLAVAHVLVMVPVVGGDAMTFYALFCAVAYGTTAVHITGVVAGILGVLTQAAYWSALALFGPYGGWGAALGSFVGLTLIGTITIVAVWALANLQRARVRQLALSRERAEQAVREREQRTALAVADERARIAREMHDVVAHSLSVIIAQADGGRFVAAQKPEQAAEVLGTIGETGRAALADMRSLLGVLRQEDETGFGPQPGPRMLPDLVERVRSAGLEVSLEIDGALEDLPQALGVSLFRLVQEALTNVLKHGGPGASAAVRIIRSPTEITVEVIDDGRGSDPDSDGLGHGLTGMRERMAAFEGTLQAEPLPARGFRVRARVPLRAGTAPAPTAPAPTVPGPSASPGPASDPTASQDPSAARGPHLRGETR